MATSMREVTTKYAVVLSPIANSFFDPISKANLFRDTPYYLFNHEPTSAIRNAIRGNKLIDIKGNIPLDVKNSKATQEVDIEAIKASVRKEIESEVRAELAAEQAELAVVEVEKANEQVSEQDSDKKDVKSKSKSKEGSLEK